MRATKKYIPVNQPHKYIRTELGCRIRVRAHFYEVAHWVSGPVKVYCRFHKQMEEWV